jgi:hypothetical protein
MRFRFLAEEVEEYVPNIEALSLLELFLVCAVSSLLVVRVFLEVTNFPKLGAGNFHIAHMLWGGMLMFLAITLLLSFLSSRMKKTATVIGGIGFGMFIDELGKFITANNNYFFEPTIALIYVIFIGIFFLFRFLGTMSTYSAKTYTINAIEELKELVLVDLDVQERSKAIQYLEKADQRDQVVVALKRLISQAKPRQTKHSWLYITLRKAFDTYRSIISTWLFSRLVMLFFAFSSVFHLTLAVAVISQYRTHISYSYVGYLASSVFVVVLVAVGSFFFLRGRRLVSYQYFQRATLVSILLSQFFLFFFQQLTAVVWLVLYTSVFLLLKYSIENRRRFLTETSLLE